VRNKEIGVTMRIKRERRRCYFYFYMTGSRAGAIEMRLKGDFST
jgi:hypothetical protein